MQINNIKVFVVGNPPPHHGGRYFIFLKLFTDNGIDAIATLANEVNHGVENIGARRLHTVMEKLLEDISFTATDKAGTKLVVDEGFVRDNIGDLVSSADLSKFIL